MKKQFKTMAFALAALLTAAFTFTSCDDDESIAYTLEGTWEGHMYQQFEYDGHIYEPSSTEICFFKDPYRYAKGEGYWIDNFRGIRGWSWSNDYIINNIKWEVRNGNIYILLLEDDIEFSIRNYRLNDRYFSGTLWGDDGSYGEFSMRHVDSPNWGYYGVDYGYSYYDPYYYHPYSKSRSDNAPTDRPVRITK